MINYTGMRVLGAWGVANIAAGGAGYFIAKNDEWKYFHAMNASWGVVNTVLSLSGLHGCRKQAAQKTDAKKAFAAYKHDKKIYLINLGFDAAYTIGGVLLVEHGNNTTDNPELYKGFGKSIAIQGVFLMVFDDLMFAAHQKYNSRWAVILDEMRFTGMGFSYAHTIKGRAERLRLNGLN